MNATPRPRCILCDVTTPRHGDTCAQCKQANRKALRIVRTGLLCHGRTTLVCGRTDCDLNTAHEGTGKMRCSLALASVGEHTYVEVAEEMGVTDSYIQQVEARALDKLSKVALKEHVR